MTDDPLGFAHFLGETDAVGLATFAILVLMSLLSWYRIAVKCWHTFTTRTNSRDFLAAFRADFRHEHEAGDNPFARVQAEGLAACRLLKEGAKTSEEHAFVMASPDDFVSAALARALARENRRLDEGLTLLASIASSAPFIGLFGTVWGIHHALLSISVSGQASLDKVAGPVGEALVMTACGLFVAIPAVLAYNAFTRINRELLGELESHAHDVFGLLALGRFAASSETVDFTAYSSAQTIEGVR